MKAKEGSVRGRLSILELAWVPGNIREAYGQQHYGDPEGYGRAEELTVVPALPNKKIFMNTNKRPWLLRPLFFVSGSLLLARGGGEDLTSG